MPTKVSSQVVEVHLSCFQLFCSSTTVADLAASGVWGWGLAIGERTPHSRKKDRNSAAIWRRCNARAPATPRLQPLCAWRVGMVAFHLQTRLFVQWRGFPQSFFAIVLDSSAAWPLQSNSGIAFSGASGTSTHHSSRGNERAVFKPDSAELVFFGGGGFPCFFLLRFSLPFLFPVNPCHLKKGGASSPLV